ncbi:histidine kinase [Streptomyces sp. MZ04]|uniref:sensor histidine kinase n=1 Tax=Streptomyces sp. MZ04 TaxID=2559236 RepID=UPI00107E8A80|nr:histidine kinase [Streptomyces sp. MZ04]TGA97320.1 hypothetical protein E2651_31510 [Streptomyces sp. MZ04]
MTLRAQQFVIAQPAAGARLKQGHRRYVSEPRPLRRSLSYDVTLSVLAVLYSVFSHLVLVPMWSTADARFAALPLGDHRGVALGLAILASVSMTVRRAWPLVPALLATVDVWVHGTMLLYPVAIYTLGVQGRLRWAIAFGAVGAGVPVLNPIHAPFHGFIPQLPFPALLVYDVMTFVTPMIAIPLFVAATVRAHRMAIGSHQDRAERARRQRTLQARNARLEERTRLASDLHDLVAHYVGLMVIHAGALEVRRDGPSETAQRAQLIGDLGRRAMEELRDLFDVLHVDDVTDSVRPRATDPAADMLWVQKVEDALNRARSTGTPVTWEREGELTEAHQAAYEPAYRTIQEGLSNATRHAPGAHVHVSVTAHPQELQVRVRNAPAVTAVISHAGGGKGLAGLRERAARSGGIIRARPTADGGFELLSRIPAAGGPQDSASGRGAAPPSAQNAEGPRRRTQKSGRAANRAK